MAYGKYWIYSDEDVNQAIQATCEGNSLSVNQSHIAIGQSIKHVYASSTLKL